jgi:hypothetical protein
MDWFNTWSWSSSMIKVAIESKILFLTSMFWFSKLSSMVYAKFRYVVGYFCL